MKCQDYCCLLLGMTSCDHDAKSSVCRSQAAVAPLCQSVAAAGSASGPASTLASLAESKQNTNDKVKAYLTDIMWIITRSLVQRYLEIRTSHRDRPAVHTRAGPLQQQKAAELQQEMASRQSPKSTARPSGSRTRRLDPSAGPGLPA
jgi:hypothetical protein